MRQHPASIAEKNKNENENEKYDKGGIVTSKAIYLASANGVEKLDQLNAVAAERGLVAFERVDPNGAPEAIAAACAGAQLLIGADRQQTTDIACSVPGLQLVQTFSAGTNSLDKAQLLNRGIKVANNGGANAVCVAELAITFMVMINHKIDDQIRSARAGHWMSGVKGDLSEFQTMFGRKVGIVGLGQIGSRVAKRLVNWECEVVYHDVIDHDTAYVAETGAQRVSLDELVASCDLITLHVPLDSTTHHMISSAEFEAMKSTAILINTCRGPVVDETAMIHALKTGAIHGAGMDVTETEPVDPQNPLLTMPNVVLTPHLGGRALQNDVNATRNAVENAERIAQGLVPKWVVDPV